MRSWLICPVPTEKYSAGGDGEIGSEWLDRFAAWLRAGDITFPYVSVPGIHAALRRCTT
ncbi:hypothetical protein [Actinomadura rudentiformis]|uniref:hypothetical protein n=1 Tax=Actinomadura rudentiformis TaxID=359158 RepID=UPI00178C2902|nr:hypothetical protein [Actinomadura rudentiformis]